MRDRQGEREREREREGGGGGKNGMRRRRACSGRIIDGGFDSAVSAH